jgi:hypothetical protein
VHHLPLCGTPLHQHKKMTTSICKVAMQENQLKLKINLKI